ncbi:MAG: hypothetical protein WD271_01875 [Acidimicrobiia bacterium]
MSAPLALEFTTTVLVIIAIASVLILVLIVVAPWRRVREEPPLDPDVETRLLLHRPNPEEETGEIPTGRVTDLTDAGEPANDRANDRAGGEPESGDFAELHDLDD